MNRLRADAITDIALKAGCIVLENGAKPTVPKIRLCVSLFFGSVFSFIVCNADGGNAFVYRCRWKALQRNAPHNQTGCQFAQSRPHKRIVAPDRKTQKGRKTQDFSQIEYVLRRVHSSQTYAPWAVLLCAACSSFVFALMFAGSFKDALGASAVGFVLRLIVIRLEKTSLNGFILSLIYGAAVSVLSELAFCLGGVDSALTVTTAVLMQVVPGLAIVNAIRDIIAGDLVSGAARTLEAFMVAAGLSAGSVLGLLVFSRLTERCCERRNLCIALCVGSGRILLLRAYF